MSQEEHAPTSSQWMSIWENLHSVERVPMYIGLFVLTLVAVAIGFIGSERVAYADEFYNVNFAFEFLEDVRPGTKVRYQGALIVGEVLEIESTKDIHIARARLKKDFHIPKMGSRVTLQTWGYFGGKFINIDILPEVLDADTYAAGENIPVEKIVNSTIVLQKIHTYFKTEGQAEALIEQELEKVKQRTEDLTKSPYARPRYVRYVLSKITVNVRGLFTFITGATNRIYSGMEGTHDSMKTGIDDLKKSIAELRRDTDKISQDIGYKSGSVGSRVLHEETDYELVLKYSELTRRLMEEFKEEPYRILFGDY